MPLTARRPVTKLEVITADVNTFTPVGRFARVMSIEMFEHMRHWQELLRRIGGWLVSHYLLDPRR